MWVFVCVRLGGGGRGALGINKFEIVMASQNNVDNRAKMLDTVQRVYFEGINQP